MKAVVSVLGKDQVGILAKVSTECASVNANVLEVSQNIMQDMFAMIMMIDISNLSEDFKAFAAQMEVYGEEHNLKIHVMHEDIFNAMHRI
ncbi:MAG: ACT domain-containing protein [Erysipelotrichaceae bacterium]